jgi:hypothetical protein
MRNRPLEPDKFQVAAVGIERRPDTFDDSFYGFADSHGGFRRHGPCHLAASENAGNPAVPDGMPEEVASFS